MKYVINVCGCDDDNSVLADLTAKQAEAVERIAEALTAASTSDCMPRMWIRKATKDDIALMENAA